LTKVQCSISEILFPLCLSYFNTDSSDLFSLQFPALACLYLYFASGYLSDDLCVPTTTILGRQHLRSAATGTLLVPCTQTATGQRSFAVNGPATWNRLPPALWSLDLSESTFRQALKTHLFSTARRHRDIFMILAPDMNIQTYLLTYFIIHV